MKHLGIYIAVVVVLVLLLVGWYLYQKYDIIEFTSLSNMAIDSTGSISFTGTTTKTISPTSSKWIATPKIKLHIASLGAEIVTTVTSTTVGSLAGTYVLATPAKATTAAANTAVTLATSDYAKVYLK